MRRADDPLLAFRFVLELGALQAAGFQECTGLQMETRTFDYNEGGRNSSALKFPERGTVALRATGPIRELRASGATVVHAPAMACHAAASR